MFDPEAESEEDAYYPWNLGEEVVEDVDGELRLYIEEPYEKVMDLRAPGPRERGGEFSATGSTSSSWAVPLRQQMRVKMPTFNFEEGQAAIADYFAIGQRTSGPLSMHGTFASARVRAEPRGCRRRQAQWPALSNDITDSGLGIQELSDEIGISVADLRGIEEGNAAAIAGRFGKLTLGVRGRLQNVRALASPSSSPSVARHLTSRCGVTSPGRQCRRSGGSERFKCHWNNGTPPGEAAEPGGEIIPCFPSLGLLLSAHEEQTP